MHFDNTPDHSTLRSPCLQPHQIGEIEFLAIRRRQAVALHMQARVDQFFRRRAVGQRGAGRIAQFGHAFAAPCDRPAPPLIVDQRPIQRQVTRLGRIAMHMHQPPHTMRSPNHAHKKK
jgi:hypothetical protein